MNKKTISTIFTVLPFIIIMLLFRPTINLRCAETVFLFVLCFLIGFLASLIYNVYTDNNDDEFDETNKIFGILTIVFLLILLGGLAMGSPLFNATNYYSRLDIEEFSDEEDFKKVVKDLDINSVPRIDASVAKKLANRKLGELEEVVSQFEVDTDYSTLINYQGRPYRVIPLKYAGDSLFKYWSNKNSGIPGYILVDLITQKADYIKFKEGMKYSPSAYFSKDLNKHIKNKYPTAILGEYNFEIDEEGIPYWIISEITVNAGVNGVQTIDKVIVVNAINGDINKYEIKDIPKWIDRALDTDLVLSQIDSWGKYKSGFLNSLFGQKGVKESTALYNFIIQDDDVYLYTGITSANGSDQSNIGFCLVNTRTSKAKFVKCASVNEKSAKSSAKTIYQEKKYKATDPLLLNINDEPTYFTSLKDDAGLVKVYVLVNAVNYKTVGYASESEGIEKAIENYKLALEGKGFTVEDYDSSSKKETKPVELENIDVKVDDIKEITIEGTTSYYILSGDTIVVAPITADMKVLPTLAVGDKITVNAELKSDYYLVHSIEK